MIVPKLFADMDEATIVRWMKQVGEGVAKDEPIVEIETDKANYELKAPARGTLASVDHAAGEVVPATNTIGWIEMVEEGG